MKKFLAMLLALAMTLSLCACSGGDKSGEADPNDGGSSKSQQTEVSNPGSDDGDTSEPPEKVTGDRVDLTGQGDEAKHMPTDFELGAADGTVIMVPERMPIDKVNVKMALSVDMGEDIGTLKMTAIKNDSDAVELETTNKDGAKMTSRMFMVDDGFYMYINGTDGTDTMEGLYKLPTQDEVEGGVDPTDLTSMSDSIFDSFSFVDDDEAASTSENPFESFEYVGLIDGKDTFKATNSDKWEGLITIDHETGWITGINVTTPEPDVAGFYGVAIRIEYNTQETLTMDVSNAITDESEIMTPVMFILGQMASFAGDEDGFHSEYELDPGDIQWEEGFGDSESIDADTTEGGADSSGAGDEW